MSKGILIFTYPNLLQVTNLNFNIAGDRRNYLRHKRFTTQFFEFGLQNDN